MESGTLTSRRTAPRAQIAAHAGVVTAAPLAGIVLLGALLRLWAFDRVEPNPYYDAAVRSMTLSWHNFFFGAFEPGAQVSIDKAPGDLWLQVASVKLLGFTAIATRVPEVAAGILAIPLLYDLVRRLFGRRAGLGAAAALAVLPTAVLTAHSDTMDSVMMLLDVLAAWLVVVGAQSRRAWPIVAAGGALGLAFNVKLFEALIFLPALALLMLIAVDLPWRRRALAFGGSLVAFLTVSLGWIATASLTPLSGRPWPIGSTNGSIWNVIFVFNGIDRLRTPATPAALALDPPGAARFFRASGHGYATTVGTMLLAALVLGACAAAAGIARRRADRRADRPALAGAVFLGTWLVLGVGLLSHMQRLQPRYLEAATPAIAAAVGVGLAGLVAAARPGRRLSAGVLVGAAAVVATGSVLLASPPTWAVIVAVAAVAGCAAAAVLRSHPQRTAALLACSLVAVLAVPASGAVTVARQHRSDAGVPLRTSPARLAALSRFLINHQGQARYEVASPSVVRAAPLIIRDARPVLMLTSLKGRPLLDGAALKRLVATGQVRYALLGRASCSQTGCADAIRWAQRHAVDVSAAAGQPPRTLFRLVATPAAGRAR
ncbi:MAG TPA: glycosyltransferase family 39 protein [Baekduia sp.]|uniref:ArnT family glycosyltransferase n=1 Tax=Baekduia sp. TaxID=2600305 RepID=UPI002C11AD85|nr:glycosyltransferase family 39 protein [Baekduia sp.]HMJ32353.1 glycosyltransferase family 39 protein [Baekduia sp.]